MATGNANTTGDHQRATTGSTTTSSAKGSGSGAPAAVNGWTRKDRPCDACRRRKSRCIISEDAEACILCQARNEACTFVQSPQRRKRRRVDVGSSPEEGAVKPRSPADADQDPRAKLPINDYADLPGPSLLKQTLGLQNRQYGQYLGLTTEYDSRLVNLYPSSERKDEYAGTPGTLRPVSNSTHFLMRSEDTAEAEEEMATLDAIENLVKPHGQALIDLYFRIIHPSFPILHKKVFLEKYSRTYREFTPPVLAGVYILALNWWSYAPDLVALPNKPNLSALEKLVPKSFGDVLNRPKLSTVQGGLLLLQRPEGDSWALTGQLVAVGQNLGLHLDCSNWRIPEWERALRRRLGWALFMQDKWGALVHGRPPHIQRENWMVKPVEPRDFPETAKDDDDEEGSAEVEKGRLLFVHMISLSEILGDVLDAFFTLRAVNELDALGGEATMSMLERAKPVQIRLKEWYANLPACLSMEATKARKLSSTGSLHLAYLAAEVTLHRALIHHSSHPHTPPHLRAITRSAARMRFLSACTFVSRLTPAHLQSFWYFASRVHLAIIGTFGALLWATSDNETEREFYRAQLAEYRWTLRVSSKAAEFMRFAVGCLDRCVVFAKGESASPAALVSGNAGSGAGPTTANATTNSATVEVEGAGEVHEAEGQPGSGNGIWESQPPQQHDHLTDAEKHPIFDYNTFSAIGNIGDFDTPQIGGSMVGDDDGAAATGAFLNASSTSPTASLTQHQHSHLAQQQQQSAWQASSTSPEDYGALGSANIADWQLGGDAAGLVGPYGFGFGMTPESSSQAITSGSGGGGVSEGLHHQQHRRSISRQGGSGHLGRAQRQHQEYDEYKNNFAEF